MLCVALALERPHGSGADASLRRMKRIARPNRWLPDALALLSLGSFIALLFRNTLFNPGVLAGFDLVNYFYPLKTYAARRLAAGDIPLWNPDLFFGSPFLANIQNGVLYPPNLLFSWLSFPDALLANTIGHFWWGALGMYLLVRLGWGCSRFAALLAGGVFAGSGFLGAHVGHLNQVQAAVWLPWLLLSLERAAGGSVVWLVLGGWLLALQLLAGHTQEVYYSLLTVGIWAVALVVLRRPDGWRLAPGAWRLGGPAGGRFRHRQWRTLAHQLPRIDTGLAPLIVLVVVVVNAAGLAAAQLLPTIELSGLSHRAGGLTLDEATALAVDRTHILESLLPTFWELPSQEVIGYVGVAALVVALAGLTHPLRLGRAVVLAGIAALAVTLALGRYTSVYLLLHDWLPAFDAFRAPGRWLFIVTVALAGLAGLGADAALRRWSGSAVQATGHGPRTAGPHRAALLTLALVAVVGGLALYAWRSLVVVAIPWLPHGRVVVLWSLVALLTVGLVLHAITAGPRWWHRLLLLGLVAGELLFAARPMEYQHSRPAEVYAWNPAVAQQLVSLVNDRSGTGGSTAATAAADSSFPLSRQSTLAPRLLSITDDDRVLELHRPELARVGVAAEAAVYTRYHEQLRPNLHLVFGLSSADGYDGGLLPLRAYAPLQQALASADGPVTTHHTLAVLARRGCTILTPSGLCSPDAAVRNGDALAVLGQYGIGYVIMERNFQPPGDWQRVSGTGASVALYRHPAPAPRIGVQVGGEAERSARVIRFTSEHVEVDVSEHGTATLILRQTPYPGWRVAIDDRPAVLGIGDDRLSLTVTLPATASRVRIWYDPWTWKAGLIISSVTILLNVGLSWTWVMVRRRRRTPRQARTAGAVARGP